MGGLGSPPGAPLFSPRPWTPAHDCWNLWLSLGHRGDSSCTWCADTCGVAVVGCLVVPHVPVSCGVSLFSYACRWARVAQGKALKMAISQMTVATWLGLCGD